MPDTDAAVATFATHAQAEQAVQELKRGGFDMTKLSIIGKGYHTDEHVLGYYNTGDRVKFWGKQGAFWGGLWGFLVGSAFFWVPGIGPLVVGGPLVTWIIGALEGAIVGGGLGVIGSALYSIGIPKDSIVQYESAVKAGEYLLVAHGTADDVAKAKSILQSAGGAKSVTQHQIQPQAA
jgi:hypothetical protein